MSFAIDLKEYGSDLKQAYESVVSSDPETTWAVFDYAAADNVLKPSARGPGDLDDFVEAFDDAKVQYGLAQVEFNSINKIALIGWVGENVPSRQRLVFNAHMSAVAKQFPGHHVQITARSSDELSPAIILDRVSAAAGSKYAAATKPAPSTKPAYVTAKDGANEEDWGDAQDVEERELRSGNGSGSGYKSSVRDELEQLRKGKKSSAAAPKPAPAPAPAPAKRASAPKPDSDDSADEKQKAEDASENDNKDNEDDEDKPRGISGLNSGTSYKPVGKIDLKAIREAGKNSKFADARVEKIESSYKPVGKVDLKAIREQARKEKELKSHKDDSAAPPPARRSPAAKTSAKHDDSADERSEGENEPTQKPAPKSSSRNRAAAAAAGDDEDEPQLGSLSDRMKAFQASIGAAKPKFDASSRPSGSSRSSASSYKPAAKASSAAQDKLQGDGSDKEDDAPISVAAQLAKARLGGQNKDESPSLPRRGSRRDEPAKQKDKDEDEDEDQDEDEDEDKGPKGNVSTFAARFAAKAPSQDEPKRASERDAPAKAAESDNEESGNESSNSGGDFDEEPAPPAPKRSQANGASTNREEPKQEIEDDSADSANGLTGTVQFEHEKEDEDEISLSVGETITEIQEVDENWYLGRNSKGDVGLFPAEFVEIKGKKEDAAKSAPTPKSEPSEERESSAASVSGGKVAIAQYDYEAGDEDELEFEENEKITEIEFPSEDWWSGKNSKGKIGLFPASYVTLQ